jgi:hypothetical protein
MDPKKLFFENLFINSKIEEINVSCNDLKQYSESVNIIATAIEKNVYLKKLDISKNRLGKEKEGFKKIADSLALNKDLQDLNLADNQLETMEILNYFAKNLKKNKHLKRLNLSGNNFSKGKKNHIKILNTIALHHSLITIDLSNTCLNKNSLVELVKIIELNNICLSLNISDNGIGNDKDGVLLLSKAITKNSTLTGLNLSLNLLKNSINELETLGKAIFKNTVLKELDLSNNFSLAYYNFPKTLLQNPDPNKFMLLPIVKALGNHKSITMLNLSENYLGNCAAKYFFEYLSYNKVLIDLNLSNTGIGGLQRVSFLLASAIIRNTSLKKINLSNNNFGQDEQAFNRLGKALALNKEITRLDFSNSIYRYGLHILSSILMILSTILIKNQSLTFLKSIESFSIGVDEIKQFSKAIKLNTTLTELDLSSLSPIEWSQPHPNQEVEILGRAFAKNFSLSFINFPFSYILLEDAFKKQNLRNINVSLGVSGQKRRGTWSKLIKLIQKNWNLQEITIQNPYNESSKNRRLLLASALDKNRNLKNISLCRFFKGKKKCIEAENELITSLFSEKNDLEKINLDNNHLGDSLSILEKLSELILKKHLKNLVLSNNSLSQTPRLLDN